MNHPIDLGWTEVDALMGYDKMAACDVPYKSAKKQLRAEKKTPHVPHITEVYDELRFKIAKTYSGFLLETGTGLRWLNR